MFMTRKKFEEAVAKERIKLEDEFRDKMDRFYNDQYRRDDMRRIYDDMNALRRRVESLEKVSGLVEEPKCPCMCSHENKVANPVGF